MTPIIETRNLTKSFTPGVVAVSGLDLEVQRGSIYGLIGRNGAGKTTTLRLLMGLLRPDQGTARILGHDFWTAGKEVRQRVAYVSQAQQLPGWMTLTELCRYASHFYERWDQGVADDLAKRWELPWRRPIARLSGGEQRQVALLVALAASPEVLLLDEPAAGVDAIARRGLLSSLIDVTMRGFGCTILFSTHWISDLERVADYVGIMDRGRLITSTRLDDLLRMTRRVQVVFDQSAPPADFAIPGAIRAQVAGPVVSAIARLTSDTQLDGVRALRGARLNVFPLGLEEIFVELFGHNASASLGATTEAPAAGEPAELAAQDDRIQGID